MLWKKAARIALHHTGGLAVLRKRHRREFAVAMFHSFSQASEPNVEALCSHIARHFEPVSLSAIIDAMNTGNPLPGNAITVTVDDGYRNFLLHGHPIFRRHHIPSTVYAVAGFSAGRLWLWPDQIAFGLHTTSLDSIRASLRPGAPMELPLGTPAQKSDAVFRLTEALKQASNEDRLAFLSKFGSLCGVDIPPNPPHGREAMNADELRTVAAEGVEIGCHTETHPILSRVTNAAELQCEIRGAKEHLEERVGFPIRHFCYPNGRSTDFSDDAVRAVKNAGFASAVTCNWGFNTMDADRFGIRRIPLDSTIDFSYAQELLAGLHM